MVSFPSCLVGFWGFHPYMCLFAFGKLFCDLFYIIPLNRHHRRIITAPNSTHTIRSSGRNKCSPRIVAAATICGTCTHMEIISDDDYHAGRAVCAVQLVSMADNRTERLRLLLTASNSCHCILLHWSDCHNCNLGSEEEGKGSPVVHLGGASASPW